MKLYSGPLSLFTAKTRIALAEKGLDYELVSVPWSREDRYEPKHADVVRINPKRQVPCLEDDGGVVIYDSTLIAEYLEDRYPEPHLLPTDPAEKARCRRLELEADEVLFPNIWTLIDERFYPRPEGEGVSEVEREAAERIAWYYERLETALGDRQWLCGEFTVADIAHFVFVTAAATLGEPIPAERAVLTAWYARASERPSLLAEAMGLAEASAASIAA